MADDYADAWPTRTQLLRPGVLDDLFPPNYESGPPIPECYQKGINAPAPVYFRSATNREIADYWRTHPDAHNGESA